MLLVSISGQQSIGVSKFAKLGYRIFLLFVAYLNTFPCFHAYCEDKI